MPSVSTRFARASATYSARPSLLGRLFAAQRKPERSGEEPVRVGLFGAVRPQKTFMTAAAAAVAMQKMLGIPLEIHMTTGGEGDGGSVSQAITQMCDGIPDLSLIRHNWKPGEEFIEEVADGILMGVPSVVSSSITWAPQHWKADADDVMDVARVGIDLLAHREAEARRGYNILAAHNDFGLKKWEEYFEMTEAR